MDQDIETVQKMIAMLRKEGYCAEHIGQKSKLLNMIRNNMIDVLIIDVDAEVTKSYEIISLIKNIDRLLPIIVTTSDDSIEVAARVREQGIFFFTIKPLDMDEIKMAIQNALGRRYTDHGKSFLEEFEVRSRDDLDEGISEKTELYNIQKHLNWIMAFFVHECKGTLGAVMMNISALVDRNIGRHIDPGKQSKMLLSSLCSLKMLHDMIRNYAISYIGENKRLPCSKKNTDLYTDCLEPVIKEFGPILEKNEMNIKVNTKGARIVNCDAELMKIGLSNLINNAIKYGTIGSDIRCELLVNGKAFKFSILNEGMGVEKERLGDIFEKHARFDRVGISGTGLGLHVVKMITDLHNGSIRAESGYLITENPLTYDEFDNSRGSKINNKADLKRYTKFIFEIPSVVYKKLVEVKNERTKSNSNCR